MLLQSLRLRMIWECWRRGHRSIWLTICRFLLRSHRSWACVLASHRHCCIRLRSSDIDTLHHLLSEFKGLHEYVLWRLVFLCRDCRALPYNLSLTRSCAAENLISTSDCHRGLWLARRTNSTGFIRCLSHHSVFNSLFWHQSASSPCFHLRWWLVYHRVHHIAV